MSDITDKMHSISAEALRASSLGPDAPAEAEERADAAREAVQATLAVASAAEETLAHWQKQANEGLVPAQGAALKRGEAQATAQELARTSLREFDRAYDEAREAVIAGAIPKVTTEREHLARQEFSLALGDAQGAEAVHRLFGLCQGGSDEARAVVNTSFARQALLSKAVPDVDKALSDARRLLVEASDGPAKSQLEKLEALEGARLAATKALDHAIAGN